jgi:hypothetical protein
MYVQAVPSGQGQALETIVSSIHSGSAGIDPDGADC